MVADVGVSRYPNGGERLQRLGQPERLRRCERFEDSITKHGEVSFPTQVRYDVVFIIGPFIIIKALMNREQVLCQHGKNHKKHGDNILCNGHARSASQKVLQKCTGVLQNCIQSDGAESSALGLVRGMPKRCRRSHKDLRLMPSFCASSVSFMAS